MGLARPRMRRRRTLFLIRAQAELPCHGATKGKGGLAPHIDISDENQDERWEVGFVMSRGEMLLLGKEDKVGGWHGLSGIDVEEMNGWMVSRNKGV